MGRPSSFFWAYSLLTIWREDISKVFEIISVSTGGPTKETGKDVLTTHAGMNISNMELNAVADDVLQAFEKHNVGKKERDEALAILWAVKDQVVNGKMTTRALSPN